MTQRQENYGDSRQKESLPPEMHPGTLRECLSDCLESARQLIGVLHEEALILKAFKGHDLLHLLPRKEFLVTQFADQSERLKRLLPSDDTLDAGIRDDRLSLKAQMLEIRRLNAANRSFIHGALEYWEDLLSLCLAPYASSAYSPAHSRSVSALAPKGWSVSKEI